MTKNTKFGTFGELMAGKDGGIVEIGTALRRLILTLHSETVEVVRLGDKAASFGVGPKKMSEAYAYIMPHKNHVNLGFYYGATLPDPEELLEGSGKKLRHVKIRSLERVSDPAVSALIKVAIAERKEALKA